MRLRSRNADSAKTHQPSDALRRVAEPQVGSRIRESSGLFRHSPKSHDFGYDCKLPSSLNEIRSGVQCGLLVRFPRTIEKLGERE
jgi:hypothetical protein